MEMYHRGQPMKAENVCAVWTRHMFRAYQLLTDTLSLPVLLAVSATFVLRLPWLCSSVRFIHQPEP